MRKSLVLAGTLAVLAGVGSIAWAAIPSGDGVIYGCYLKVNGNLRVIDGERGANCSPAEESISWSQAGPQGPAGSPGISKAFSTEAGNEVPIADGLPATNLLTLANVPAGKYVIVGNVVVHNLTSTGTIPVLCQLAAATDQSVYFGARIDPFRWWEVASGASTTTIALTMTADLAEPSDVNLRCQGNTGTPTQQALAAGRQITAMQVGNLVTQTPG